MTVQDIITKYELFMDDTSELSSQEKLDLFNKIYSEICMDRPWEFLKKSATGTTSTTVPYISLPSDFSYITQDGNYTESSFPSSRPVVFRGSTLKRYEVVSWSDRRQYNNMEGYAYVDIVNGRLYFTKQPTVAESVEYDYMSVPTALALSDTPAIPSRFLDMIYHYMCVDDFSIQQSDKAKSYANENRMRGDNFKLAMAYWNANLIQQ